MNSEDLRTLISKRQRELQEAQDRLAAIERDPVLMVASELHALLCGEWCDHGKGAYESSHFDPLPLMASTEGATSIEIARQRIYQRYTEAAQLLLKTGPAKDIVPILRVLVDVKKRAS